MRVDAARLRADRERLRVQPALGIPSVHIDNATAAAEAMDHLYRLGHRRIGIVTGPLVSPLSRDRLRGATARARRRPRAERRLHRRPRRLLDRVGRGGAASGCSARRQPPTAIFCFNDEMAMGVIETARAPQAAMPDDLSVVGFDDIRFARYIDPPLTTVAQPMRQIGEGTVRLLLEILGQRRARLGHAAAHARGALEHRAAARRPRGPTPALAPA